jgi:hypothetical protein
MAVTAVAVVFIAVLKVKRIVVVGATPIADLPGTTESMMGCAMAAQALAKRTKVAASREEARKMFITGKFEWR